ncbi:MAG: formate dehydrogenase subunit gamma [Halieaceae bacterium]
MVELDLRKIMEPISMAQVAEIIAAHSEREGALLPILHAIQNAAGHIPAESVPLITRALKISRAEIQGVISFYHDFKEQPGGRHQVQLCRAESCQAMGGRAIEARVKEQLGIDFNQTTEDDEVSLEPIYCFGNCACSPAIRIDGKLYGRVGPAQLDELLGNLLPGLLPNRDQ